MLSICSEESCEFLTLLKNMTHQIGYRYIHVVGGTIENIEMWFELYDGSMAIVCKTSVVYK